MQDRVAQALEDRYRIERELGSGGMATVYLAEDLKHRRPVAVKVLHEELGAAIGAPRFVREVEISARLTHPHILLLIDSGEAGGLLYYVMPYVDGESLRARIDREGRLPLRTALTIVDQVAGALTYAHERGVVHRDVKPGNILLSGDQAVVADFGVARAVEAAGGPKLTGTGVVVGTPTYMSPEQAFDQGTVDGRTDLYALGCVLFEMLAGRPPFQARSAMGLFAKHATERAPGLTTLAPTVPPFVDRAVARAIAKDPEERFRTVAEFAETLRSETVVTPAGRRRIAVLPPVGIGTEDRQYLALGLHEALISELGRGDVAVLARTSVLQYQGRGGDRPPDEVCRELGVEAVVESSLICAGDSVGVQARLVDGNTSETVWSGSYDGDFRHLLGLYREVTRAIARDVHGVLAPTGGEAGRSRRVDPLAYENFMRGRVLQQSFHPADLDRAITYYRASLELQPDYAPAHAGLALIWGSKVVLGMVPPREYGERWRKSAEEAVGLDPNLAEGHQALAQAYTWYDFDWEKAEASYRKAIELDPNEPQARIFYSHFLGMLRREEESTHQILRAVEIDPHNPFTQTLYGIQRGMCHRFDEGIEILLDAPPNPLRSFALSWHHLRKGLMEQGLAYYAEYFELLGDPEMAAILRDTADGYRTAMVRGAEKLVERSGAGFVKPNNMVHLFSWGGDVDRAMEWLNRSLEMRDHEIVYLSAIPTSPELTADPRFQQFVVDLNLPAPDLWSPEDGASAVNGP